MSTGSVEVSIMQALEEIYEAEGILPTYQIGWTTSGSIARSDPRFQSVCRDVFDAFRERHPGLEVVAVQWPIDLRAARPVSADTPIDMDLDPDAPEQQLLFVLARPEALIDPA